MAEDQQDMLPNFAESQSRTQGVTCRRGGIFSALFIFVALLAAGQAATVYFLFQQHDQITKLKDFANEKLENTARNSSKVQDHVKYMIMKENPQLILPEFNDTILENLNKLKTSFVHERDWKDFESWMHKWMLFNSALHPSPDDSKAEAKERTPITAIHDPEGSTFGLTDDDL